jgi:hypothetical protein
MIMLMHNDQRNAQACLQIHQKICFNFVKTTGYVPLESMMLKLTNNFELVPKIHNSNVTSVSKTENSPTH